MRKALRILVALPLAAGCSLLPTSETFEGRIDYKSSGTLPPLEIPPDLTSPARDNRYVVPETNRSAATYSVYQAERGGPRTGTTAVLPEMERMRIERAGTQRWLVVQETPEKLWPLVKDFWQENGFLLKLEIPEAGVMETDWAENRARIPQGVVRDLLGKVLDQMYSSGERDKYRTRLDRAPDGKSTEIYISHRGMAEVYAGQARDSQNNPGATVWQVREPEPELEAEFLRRLMVRLGAQEQVARAMAGSAPSGEARAEIRKGNAGTEFLQVHEAFDRAWRRVGLALDRVGFTVEDRDRQKGLYFVRYADPESEMRDKEREKGLFARFLAYAAGDSKVRAEQYRVQVSQSGSASQVNVLNKDGAAESSKTTQRILSLLHEQLK